MAERAVEALPGGEGDRAFGGFMAMVEDEVRHALHSAARRVHLHRGRSLSRLALDGAGDVDARRRAELGEDVAQVRLDRLLAQEQLGGDLAVGLAVATSSAISRSRRDSDASPLTPRAAGPRGSLRAPSRRSSRRPGRGRGRRRASRRRARRRAAPGSPRALAGRGERAPGERRERARSRAARRRGPARAPAPRPPRRRRGRAAPPARARGRARPRPAGPAARAARLRARREALRVVDPPGRSSIAVIASASSDRPARRQRVD